MAPSVRRCSGRTFSRGVVTWVLRSPFADLLDRSVMLMVVRGRRSGAEYAFPVQYAQEDGTVWVFPAHHERKRWWRNLVTESPVTLYLQGHEVSARARAFSGQTAPSVVEDGLGVYFNRFGAAARRSGVVGKADAIDQGRLAEVAKTSVIVRILPTADSSIPAATRESPTTPVSSGAVGAIRRHPLRAFYVLTFLLSWGYWIPNALAGGRWSHAPGLLGPMVSALVVTGLTKGSGGMRDLLQRMFRWKVGAGWYLWTLTPVAVALAMAGVLSLGGGSFPSSSEWSEIGGFAGISGLAAYAVIAVVNGYGEETGWRGFATPRFRLRHNEVTASLLVSIPWALWHLPTFFIGSGYRDFPLLFLPGWLLGVFALAVVMTWTYEGARSSILIAVLMHLSLNIATTTAATEGAVSAVVTMAVIACSVVIAAGWRRRAEQQSASERDVRFGEPR